MILWYNKKYMFGFLLGSWYRSLKTLDNFCMTGFIGGSFVINNKTCPTIPAYAKEVILGRLLGSFPMCCFVLLRKQAWDEKR
jgi:hypothetical protein